jgi:Fur family transcriptional regulator, ferric uptake regulator
MHVSFQEQAETMIRRAGERVTPSRMRVLAVLLAELRAVTHHDIEERLSGGRSLNRVTLYRVLEWLNEKSLAHRVVSDDRVWRFRANTSISAHTNQHAHFKCMRCTAVVCLDDLKAKYDGLMPSGYRPHEFELTVKGLCAACA